MTGLNNFINLFGQVTLSTVVELVLAGVFLYLSYKKVRDFLIERYEAEKARDQRINEALDAVHKYPEYRAQSIKIQQTLENEIQNIRKTINAASVTSSATGIFRVTVTTQTKKPTPVSHGHRWRLKPSGDCSAIMKRPAATDICTQ